MTDKDLGQSSSEDVLQNQIPSESWKDWVRVHTQEAVADALQGTLVKKIQDSLEEQSLWKWNINTESKPGWFQKISICSKDVAKKTEGQIAITVKPNWKISFHINPYEHFEDFYYIIENISPEEYFQYSEGFNQIIDWKLPEDVEILNSIEKVMYPNMDDYM